MTRRNKPGDAPVCRARGEGRTISRCASARAAPRRKARELRVKLACDRGPAFESGNERNNRALSMKSSTRRTSRSA